MPSQGEKVVVVNEMPYEEAKEKVVEYFKIHKKGEHGGAASGSGD